MTQTICNMCGKTFDLFDEQSGIGFGAFPSYGSKYDGTPIALDLCNDCFDAMMDTYILPKCVHNPMMAGDD